MTHASRRRIRHLCHCALLALVCVIAVASTPEKSLCPVCALNGEENAEKVEATSSHDGKSYYFCSDDCKQAFDEDPEPYLPPLFPRPAPSFSLSTLGGKPAGLTDFTGRLVLVDFWATWCKPCEKGMPRLNEIYASHGGDAFTVLGVSIDDDEKREAKVRKFLDKRDIDYPIAIDDVNDPAWAAFKVRVVPSLFLVDGSGRIVAQWIGKADFDDVESTITRSLEAMD